MADIERIWLERGPDLKRFIQRRVSDRSAAEDLLQEVLLKIHTYRCTLRDNRNRDAWAFRIARNAVIDHYRRNRPLVPLIKEPAGADGPEPGLASTRITPCVRAMVDALPGKYREALLLTAYKGLTQQKMGEQLGISVSGAKSRTQRARAKLKTLLTDCCRFELDAFGNVVDFEPRSQGPA